MKPGSFGSPHTTPQPAPKRWSQGLSTEALIPMVSLSSDEYGQIHVPLKFTVTVPLAFCTTVPGPAVAAVGVGEFARAAFVHTPATMKEPSSATKLASKMRRRALDLPAVLSTRCRLRRRPRSFILTPGRNHRSEQGESHRHI